MLVLSRHNGESIIIDGRIKVTIVDIRGDKVRVGIEADKEISVHREEVQIAIDREARRDGRTLGGGLGERNGEGA